MPFVSEAQQGYLHAHPEILGEKKLHEFDEATKGTHDLPKHVHHDYANAPYKMAHAARKSG